MNILLASDDNYVGPSLVLIRSIFENHKSKDINIYYMHCGLKNRNVNNLNKLVDFYGGKISFIQISGKLFENAPVYAHFTKETYFRFFAISMLPNEMDRVLYLDPDIVVNGSIMDFYQQDFTKSNREYSIIACEEKTLSKNKELLDTLGISYGSKYFNAGVLLLNLDALRKSFELDLVFSYIDENKNNLKYLDQDVLNAFYYSDTFFDDEKLYNYMPHCYKTNDDIKKARIIHFAGPGKPWKFAYKYGGAKVYRKYVNSPYTYLWYYSTFIKSSINYLFRILKKWLKH